MRLFVVLAALAGLLVVVSPGAVAEPVPAPEPSSTVSLITGDTVTLGPDGEVAIQPADSAHGSSYTTLRLDGDVYVVPDRVDHLVPDVLDMELFNITELVAMGFADSDTDTLPLIVQGGSAAFAAGARSLPSIGAVAVSVPKRDAATMLTGSRAAKKVWLDRPVEASDLDANLTQIGAPEVWASGLSGAGVDVAVLDTGVDADHPDLRGRVAEEANFTAEASAADGNGHGTHVASIIGGTGSAAGGARHGVAFGARLLSGKVLGSDGRGQASWIIAGMEWAAEQGADVVNLSLGGTAAAGDDPVAQALDGLTARTGTLFVVAAGNTGPGSSTVETPGVAASALTVGAARADGRPPTFSSNGPTRGTYRAKPDMTAPGVNIAGARAGGGTANPYRTLSGTSQATPHVAGAAALLRQQHPDWDWQRLKAALMTTADHKVAFPSPYAEGAGLLDLPGATTETLLLNRGNVDFGYLRYPRGSDPVSVELTLTNTGDTVQEVALTDEARDVYGDAATDDLFTITPAALTVAPGATERVTVTLTPAAGHAGLYNGLVSLTRPGFDTMTLPLSGYPEPPRHDVTLTVLDRHGQPWAGGTVVLGNMNELYPRFGGGFTTVRLDENGRGVGRVAPGPVSMVAKVETPASGDEPATVAFAGSPEVLVDKDISYTIDARRARRLDPATVDGVPTEVSTVSVHYARQDALGRGSIGDAIYATPEEIADGRVFLQPTRPVSTGKAVVETRWRLDATGRRAETYQVVLGGPAIPNPPVYRVSSAQARNLARLDADYRSPTGVADTYAETWQAYTDLVAAAFITTRPLSVPQRRIELVTPDIRWRHCVTGPQGTVARLCEPTTAYAPRTRHSPVWFRGLSPAVIAGSHGTSRILLPVAVSDGEHQGSVLESAAAGNQELRLYRDGVELPRVGVSSYFDTPPEPALFRLDHTSAPDQARLPIGRRTATSWTFPSQAGEAPRLLSVHYQPRTDTLGRLDSWRPLMFDLRVVSTTSATDALTVEKATLRFWVSTDHGERWHKATVQPCRDGTFTAAVPGLVPRPGQTVSVRAEATAAQGRAVTQTIIDAYPVR
ncbi:S8 family serine peptidase [Actinophytocola sp.]|uniref:S8 family serine peptidase n=1 Tax=Actinophytocola sp. TaxID=1872138 RepID=UPI002ED38AB9